MRQLAISFALCLPSLALPVEASVGEIRAGLHGKVALELQGIDRDKFGDSLVLEVENTQQSPLNLFQTVSVHPTPSVLLADARVTTETRIRRKLPVDAGLNEIEVTLLDVADAKARVGEMKATGWPEKRSTEECLS